MVLEFLGLVGWCVLPPPLPNLQSRFWRGVGVRSWSCSEPTSRIPINAGETVVAVGRVRSVTEQSTAHKACHGVVVIVPRVLLGTEFWLRRRSNLAGEQG
jgi:hypothetical protein